MVTPSRPSGVERFLTTPAGILSVAASSAVLSVLLAGTFEAVYASGVEADRANFWAGVNTAIVVSVVIGAVYAYAGWHFRVPWVSRTVASLCIVLGSFCVAGGVFLRQTGVSR